MGNYRVETALSNRAGCQATECKKRGTKIDKHELRLGVWVDYGDSAGWRWRHWGCMSGKTIQSIREMLEDPEHPGTYRWDYFDGYEGDEKNSLDKHPDLQEKVRRVIINGKHDLGDFNGDEEMNRLGETGLHTAESKKRMREEQRSQTHGNAEHEGRPVTTEPAAKTDGQLSIVKSELDEQNTPSKSTKRKLKAESDEEEKALSKKKPARKSRAKKVKQEEEDEDAEMTDLVDDEPARPARKSRAKKNPVKAEEAANVTESVGDIAPVKKPRAKKNTVKVEEGEEGTNVSEAIGTVNDAPKKRAPRGKKAFKQEIEQEVDEPSVKPAPKKRAPRGKKAIKDAATEETASTSLAEPEASAVKDEPSEALEMPAAPVVNEPAADKSTADEPIVDVPAVNEAFQDVGIANAETGDSQATGVEADAEPESLPKKKERAKKTAAPAGTNARASRSRTTSKA